MNLRQLQYFKTVAELEHYTRAADALYVSQSSLSHAIAELENELGVKLFSRQGRNIRLTRHGELFYPHVKKTLETLDNGISQLRDYIDPDRGTVSLAAFSSLDAFVSDAIVQYFSETGRVDVRFQHQHHGFREIHQKLLSGDIDLGIATAIDDPRLRGAPIGAHELVLLVHEDHPFAKRESVSLRELDGENFATFDADSQLGEQLGALFQSRNIRPNIVMEARQDIVIYGLVAAGNAVAITPRPLSGVPQHVRTVALGDSIPRRDLYLLWNQERFLPPAEGYFRDFLLGKENMFDPFLKEERNNG